MLPVRFMPEGGAPAFCFDLLFVIFDGEPELFFESADSTDDERAGAEFESDAL